VSPRPPLWQLLKGSKHIAAVLVLVAQAAALYILAIGATKAGLTLPEQAWDVLDGYITTLTPAAILAVGGSSLRHIGQAAPQEPVP